jgi:hypothetical protein
MLNTYKHLQNLAFASCLLNKQLQAPTLISINTVQSVTYCSTIMLYAVFNYILLRVLQGALSCVFWKRSEFVVSRDNDTALLGARGGGGNRHPN